MIQWLADRSVRVKITLLTVFACSAVLVLASGAFIYTDRVSTVAAKERTLGVLGGAMAHTLTGPVAFQDEGSTHTVIANLKAEPTALMASVYVADGSLLSSWSPDGVDAPKTLDEARADTRGMLIVTPITGNDGTELGSLVTRYSTRDVDARLWTFLSISFGVAALSLAAVSLVLWAVRGRITRPIDLLAAAAQAVRNEADYSVRVDHRSKDELGTLAETFNAMLVGIQERDAELRAHQEDLEGLVRDRTAELDARNRGMRTVLDSVEEGLVVVDGRGQLSAERSAAFDAWFGKPVGRSTLDEHLQDVAPGFAMMLELGWEMLVEEMLPREVCLAQLPSRMELHDQVFSVAYQVLDADDEPIQSVLVVFQDVTAEEEAQRMDRIQRELANVFSAIQQDVNGFRAFLEEGDRIVVDLEPDAPVSPEVVFRRVHTLKGNASLQGLMELPPLCHDLESRLAAGEEATEADLKPVREAWAAFKERVEPMLPRPWALQVEQTDLDTLVRLSARHPEVQEHLAYLGGDAVQPRLEALGNRARLLGARLGKSVEVVVQPTSLRTPQGALDAVWNTLPHALRNALDHGIEADREAAGKDPVGRVTLSVRVGSLRDLEDQRASFLGDGLSADQRVVAIAVQDDGRGVDWDAVRARGAEKGLDVSTPRALLQTLFSDGVSTAAAVSDVSGRGVGTSALLAEVLRMEGRLEMSTETGKGTRLTLFLPTVGWALPVALGSQDQQGTATLVS